LAELGALDFSAAITDFNAAIKLKPAFSAAYSNRALALMAQGKSADAVTDLNTSIAIDPSNARAYLSRGLLRLAAASRAEAQTDFETALRLDPSLRALLLERVAEICPKGAFGSENIRAGQLSNP
jgi:tetratricopeptide (TPR) repeat protein